MSKFRDFILGVEKGAEAVTETGINAVFDTIDATARKVFIPSQIQADVLKLSADARHNLLTLVDGVEQDVAQTLADAGDEVLILLAERAQTLSSPDQIAQLGAVVIAQAQAFVAQKTVGIDPTKPAKSS